MSENMVFCLGDGQYESSGEGYQKNYRIFNKQLTKTEWEKAKNELPSIELTLNKWVDKGDMTKEEKDSNSVWKEIGGFLRTLGYEEAWKVWWDNAKQSDKDKILNCEYFDAKIFTGITGLKDFAKKSLSGKVVKVEIDGEKYEAVIK